MSARFQPPPPEENFNFLIPPKDLRYFSLGYHENVADSFWIRLIQHMHICESVEGGIAHSEERIKLREEGKLTEPACRKGWVYKMVDAVTDMAPKFRMAYVAGATSLSILVDDPEGAALIFEKGMREYPDDWKLAYRAAYHYLWEYKDNEKAADALIRAGKNGAPVWVFALAGKLMTELGRAQLAKPILEEALARDPDGPGAERIRTRLAEINKVLAAEK